MGGIILIAVVLFFVFLYYVPLLLWFKAMTSNASVGMFYLVTMRLRRVDPSIIVENYIISRQGGLIDIRANDLENHYIAGGNVQRIVQALISAKKAKIQLSFKDACAIDLAGRDVKEAIDNSVNPKVIQTPPITAVAKDGIQVKVIVQVTVKVNIKRLVGGAGEETVIARVGQGICTTIGSADNHKDVLQSPQKITQKVLEQGLDVGTAYEIISIDIADVDVGKNIGSILQIDKANADKVIAQAKAEEKKAFAVAQVHEMKSLQEEMKAKLIEAESEIPISISESFKSGNFNIDNKN